MTEGESRAIEREDRIVRSLERHGKPVEQVYEVLGYSRHGKLITLRASGTVRKVWWRQECDLPRGYRLIKASDQEEVSGN